MIRTTVPVGLSMGLLAATALAGDLSIKARLNEIFEANDNYFMVRDPAGEAYRNYTTLWMEAVNATPTTRYIFNGDVSLFHYFGPGADDTALKQGKNHSLKFSIDNFGKPKENKFKASIGWFRQDVATAQLQDIGTATVLRGNVDTFVADANITRRLSVLDTFNWSGRLSGAVFSENESSNNVSLSNSAAWSRQLTRTIAFTSVAAVDWTQRVNGSETYFYRLTGALASDLSSRLSVSAMGGVALAHGSGQLLTTEELLAGVPVLGPGTHPGWLGEVKATYKFNHTTYATLSAAHTISPDIFGNLSERDSVSASLTHDINSRQSLYFATTFTHFSASGSPTSSASASDYFTASATYRHRFTRELSGALTYYYRQRSSETSGDIRSNGVFMVLTKDFTLLP